MAALPRHGHVSCNLSLYEHIEWHTVLTSEHEMLCCCRCRAWILNRARRRYTQLQLASSRTSPLAPKQARPCLPRLERPPGATSGDNKPQSTPQRSIQKSYEEPCMQAAFQQHCASAFNRPREQPQHDCPISKHPFKRDCGRFKSPGPHLKMGPPLLAS